MRTKILTFFFLFLLVTPATGQYVVGSKESLRNIGPLYVVVEKVTHDFESAGLSTDLIKTDVELKLRLAGISILEKHQITATSAEVYVNVNSFTYRELGVFAFNVSLRIRQPVKLERNNISGFASTWETGSTGLVGLKAVGSVRPIIKDVTDILINDYLSVNPR